MGRLTERAERAKPSSDACKTCVDRRYVVVDGGRQSEARRCPSCFIACPDCGGVGYRFEDDWTGAPRAIPCWCLDIDRRIALYNDARVPRRYAEADFERGIVDVNDSVRSAKVAAFKRTSGFKPGDRGVGFVGSVGTGKTHLMAALVRELTLKNGVPCRFIEFTHLLGELRKGFETNVGTADIIADLVEIPVLIIDELGKGLATGWQIAILDELVSKRYNAQVTTFFTSNYPIEKQSRSAPMSKERFEVTTLEDQIGSRMFSRLSEMCDFVTIEAPDFRRRDERAPTR